MTVYNSTENLLQKIVKSGFLFVFVFIGHFFKQIPIKNVSHKRSLTLI